MKISNWRKEIPILLLLCSPWIVYALLLPQLLALLPTHYTRDAQGKWIVNGQMPPFNFVISMFLVSLLVYVALTLPLYFLQKREQWAGQAKLIAGMMYFLKLALALFMSGMPVYTMLAAAGRIPGNTDMMLTVTMLYLLVVINTFEYRIFAGMPAEKRPVQGKYYNILWAGVHLVSSIGPLLGLFSIRRLEPQRLVPQIGLLFLTVAGNLMHSVRPNLFFGIRTPWTLRNEEVWRRTHRMGSTWFFCCGLTGLLASFVAPESWMPAIVLTAALLPGIVSMAYSYFIYKKITHS